MKRTTTAATAAAAIRTELKNAFPGIKFSVRSEIYSGCNSVNVSYIDGIDEKRVENLLAKYQYGHFNGMEDIYENTNRRDDLPQVKYLFVRREMSDAVRDAIMAEMSITLEQYKKVWCPESGNWYATLVWRKFVAMEFGEHAGTKTDAEIADEIADTTDVMGSFDENGDVNFGTNNADGIQTKIEMFRREWQKWESFYSISGSTDDLKFAHAAFEQYRDANLESGMSLADFNKMVDDITGGKFPFYGNDDDDVVYITDGDDVDLVTALFDGNAARQNAREIPIEDAKPIEDTPDAVVYINQKPVKLDGWQLRPAYPNTVVLDAVFALVAGQSVRGLNRVLIRGDWYNTEDVFTDHELTRLSMAEMVQKSYDRDNALMFEFLVIDSANRPGFVQFHAIEILTEKSN